VAFELVKKKKKISDCATVYIIYMTGKSRCDMLAMRAVSAASQDLTLKTSTDAVDTKLASSCQWTKL